MRYLPVLIFIIIFGPVKSLAFNKDAISLYTTHTLADTDSVIRKRSIAVGVSYGSDAMFFGRTGPIKYPFLSANAIYNTKGGFFVYGSVLRLLGYRTLVDEIDVGGGYLYHINKKLSGTISYTHFIFNKEERVIESASAHDINWKNTYNWGAFKSSATLDYLFGKASDFFVTLNASKYFETDWSVFDDKDYLTFNPGVSLILGTQNFVQTYSDEHEDRINLNNLIVHGTNYPFSYNNGRFNALNYSFKVPVAYNRPHYTVEFAYKYSIPVNVEGALMNKRESFFNLTLYYVFFK